jgi:transposase
VDKTWTLKPIDKLIQRLTINRRNPTGHNKMFLQWRGSVSSLLSSSLFTLCRWLALVGILFLPQREKLAVIIWNMVTKKVPYKADSQHEFLDQKRKRKVMEMKKLIHKFDITPDDLGLQLNINNL